MYPPVARNDVVMVGRDDLLDTVLRHDDFIVCPQSSLLEVLTLVVFKLPCNWVEEISEDFWVLSVVVHPIVNDGVGWGNKASNDVGDRKYRSIEFFGL